MLVYSDPVAGPLIWINTEKRCSHKRIPCRPLKYCLLPYAGFCVRTRKQNPLSSGLIALIDDVAAIAKVAAADQNVRTQMIMLIKTLAAVTAGTVLATNAFAQSTREVRGASPYVAIENQPPPKLIVDPTPLAAGLAQGIVWIQYRAENVPY